LRKKKEEELEELRSNENYNKTKERDLSGYR